AANLVTQKIPLIGTIECHRVVAQAAAAALDELRQAGLARLIDTNDTYHNGGCWGPREQKTSDGTNGRTLSRHSWGAAIDVNPTANPQGATPNMDPRIIAAFRNHGFAWGGTFPTPDGMHFEYTGP
ncbi:MAG: M15 family metallopeptidase, partial [Acidimicrobiia bacterium]